MSKEWARGSALAFQKGGTRWVSLWVYPSVLRPFNKGTDLNGTRLSGGAIAFAVGDFLELAAG